MRICWLVESLLLFCFIAPAAAAMAGLSNHGKNPDRAYVAAGDRSYLIGTQDGDFPDMGSHVKGEMGGLWMHPIKLMDGFWAKIQDAQNGEQKRLVKASEFINYPYGNRFRYPSILNGIEVERFQFCPDGRPGVVVQYIIGNTGVNPRQLRFEFSAKTNLTPVWYSREIGIEDSGDSIAWDSARGFFLAQDGSHPWFLVWGSAAASSGHSTGNETVSEKTTGQGIGASAVFQLPLKPHDSATLTFVMAGSTESKEDAIHTYLDLISKHAELLQIKKKHYASLLSRARIKIPDARLQEVYDWVKIDTQWLIREVPDIGRGLGAGLMEYPWWFGTDNGYALQAVAATGNFSLAEQTLRLLRNQSWKKNHNGRIVHEISTNGAMPNPGNTQETAQFVMAVEKLFQWSGDLQFVREMYPTMKMGIHWLLTDMDRNKNLFPEGYGIMEVHGLNAELIDVAVYTQQALEATARIAGIFKDVDVQKEDSRLAAELASKINRYFWDEEQGSYCDFYGTTQQAVRAADGAITQLKLNEENEEDRQSARLIPYYEKLKERFLKLPDMSKGWVTNQNWVITTPMETGIAPRDKAIRLLDKIRKENVGEYGPYLSATDRNAMMTISTGVQAVSEMNYGRTDQAMWYVNRIAATFNRVLPGSISEMMPDYGCFTQAWTSYGIVVPLIRGVFGIHPDAFHRRVVFEPHLPTGWEDISIEQLPVGTNLISLSRSGRKNGVEFVIISSQNGWDFTLKLPRVSGARYSLNGKSVPFDPSGFKMHAKLNRLIVSY